MAFGTFTEIVSPHFGAPPQLHATPLLACSLTFRAQGSLTRCARYRSAQARVPYSWFTHDRFGALRILEERAVETEAGWASSNVP